MQPTTDALDHSPPPPEHQHPFATLTPDVVLDALASVGLYGDGRLMALSSYENRVYQVTLENGERVVTKFYRPERWSAAQILEEHAFAADLMAAEVPAVGPLVLNGKTLHPHSGFMFSVSPWRGGRQPELDDFEVLEWIGRFLARIHTVGAAQPFTHRPALDLRSYGSEPHDWLLAHEIIPLDMQSSWRSACEQALSLIGGHGHTNSGPDRLHLKDASVLRLHGDCHPGNILWTPLDEWGRGGPHFVDLDDARMGPAVQDLWMLLSGDRP
ncbi:MAG: serine/threonine protein kinase, partial [Giesbergeria sp.]|nr:serine/threonine protein kinase [Giesbergeria sp.]